MPLMLSRATVSFMAVAYPERLHELCLGISQKSTLQQSGWDSMAFTNNLQPHCLAALLHGALVLSGAYRCNNKDLHQHQWPHA